MYKISGPSDYEFTKNGGNNITSAVYPMREHLLQKNNERSMLGGGSILTIQTGMTRFDELGIPAGLYLEEKRVFMEDSRTSRRTEPKNQVIDDAMFEKLLGMTSSVKGKTNSSSKKNLQSSKNKKTKKAAKNV